MGDADWERESDYARFVLRGPSAEDLRHKADLDRKAAKENGGSSGRSPRVGDVPGPRFPGGVRMAAQLGWRVGYTHEFLRNAGGGAYGIAQRRGTVTSEARVDGDGTVRVDVQWDDADSVERIAEDVICKVGSTRMYES